MEWSSTLHGPTIIIGVIVKQQEEEKEIGPWVVPIAVAIIFIGAFTYYYGHSEGKVATMTANGWTQVEGDVYVRSGLVVKLHAPTSNPKRSKLEQISKNNE